MEDSQEGQGGQSIREMAEQEPTQAALYPHGSLEGDELRASDLIKPHHKIEATVSMRSAEVPIRGGLIDPAREGMALVTYALEKPELLPDLEGERGSKELVGWKIRQIVRPTFVEAVKGEAGVIEANFAALLKADEAKAMNLLERLQDRAKAALGEAVG